MATHGMLATGSTAASAETAAVKPLADASRESVDPATEWQGPNEKRQRERGRRWREFLWSLVFPHRGQRVLPTLPGVLLIAVSMGIGAAAYNTSNNILFITLSLLLACLVFSGVLSWLNIRRVSWRLHVQPPFRAGHEHAVAIELRNEKVFLPTYGLWFEVATTGETKLSRQALRGRLEAQGEARLEWSVRPEKRGAFKVELTAIGSLFPFGFLRKLIGSELRRDVVVWPAAVEYRRFPQSSWRQGHDGKTRATVGQSGDLLALRPYARGDSQRAVHWKASARLRRLMVRQFSTETHSGYAVWAQTSAEVWTRPEQFELVCSLAATMAEDLFRQGRLLAVAIDDQPLVGVRRVRDLEVFLDRLALVQPGTAPYQPSTSAGAGRQQNVLSFAPDGARGVIALVDGEKVASA